MSTKPITNYGETMMWVNNVAIPPGETKIFDEAELPPHLRGPHECAPLPTEPADRLLVLLDESVSTIVKAIEERDEQGNPVLSDDELIRLAEAETNGKTRSTLMKALETERMKRADEAEKREELAVFAESLKDMGDEQLAELAKTHQEDPEKMAAIQWQQLVNQVNQAAEQGDRELLKLLREDLPGNVEVPAAVELIDKALAKLGEGE